MGLGQNFAGLMHLADYEEALINRRIWTQQDQIEERLAELNEHIEKVIQMYLRNEYATITEYNERPAAWPRNIISSSSRISRRNSARPRRGGCKASPRAGALRRVHAHPMGPAAAAPDGLATEELRRSSVCVQRRGDGYFLPGVSPRGPSCCSRAAARPGTRRKIRPQDGKSSIDSNRVEVPFSQISPGPGGDVDQRDDRANSRSPSAAAGATKPQYLAIGKGTRQHALFAGKTGSGKSTLFHVIITNLALSCSPEQVEFYLIDFKKGVEFKCYAEKRSAACAGRGHRERPGIRA